MAHLCQSLSHRIQTQWWREGKKIKEGKNGETKILARKKKAVRTDGISGSGKTDLKKGSLNIEVDRRWNRVWGSAEHGLLP